MLEPWVAMAIAIKISLMDYPSEIGVSCATDVKFTGGFVGDFVNSTNHNGFISEIYGLVNEMP
jgi:hypothetical protein